MTQFLDRSKAEKGMEGNPIMFAMDSLKTRNRTAFINEALQKI